jgi:hypothetical protein
MDPVIKVYDGTSVLDPTNGVRSHFSTINLNEHSNGYAMPKGTFFISSSSWKIATSDKFISYVTPTIDSSLPLDTNGKKTSLSYPFLTHPNAPFHAFGYHAKRKITFENLVTAPRGTTVYAGMKQAELAVIPLTNASNYQKKSVFANQNDATLFRSEGQN